MKYTIEQIKELVRKAIVWVDNVREHTTLRNLGFNIVKSYKGSYYYAVNNDEYSNGTLRGGGGSNAYRKETHEMIEFSDIIFDNPIPLIFN